MIKEELKKLLLESEEQHNKLIVLHTVQKEKIANLNKEEEQLTHLLAVNSGRISTYKKCIELINNDCQKQE